MNRIPLITLLICFINIASAGDLYRWVDDNGDKHVSDMVPDKYKDRAELISPTSTVTDQQRLEAEQRAARMIEESLRKKADDQPGSTSENSEDRTVTMAKDGKIPAMRPTASTNCETWQQLYRESEACFGPYRLRGGGIRTEAFEKCAEIPSPEPKCGPSEESSRKKKK